MKLSRSRFYAGSGVVSELTTYETEGISLRSAQGFSVAASSVPRFFTEIVKERGEAREMAANRRGGEVSAVQIIAPCEHMGAGHGAKCLWFVMLIKRMKSRITGA